MAKGSRVSVAELAGKFSCPAPHPADAEANKPVRKRPPRTLPLPASNTEGQRQDEQKPEVGANPPRKNRNSALIEKLQASLSPTALLPSPLSPGAGKPQLPFFPPQSPSSPVSPTSKSKPSQIETPASFETPADGTILQSINKGRARLSIKRRPPSRRHRKSSGDEGGNEEEKNTPSTSDPMAPDEKEGDVFEKQKVEKEEVDGTDPVSSTPKEQRDQEQDHDQEKDQDQDQEQHKESTDSEEQPLAPTGGGEEEKVECAVSGEKEETVEEEKKSEQAELDDKNEESTKQEPGEETATEPQSEPATAAEEEIQKEVKKEEEDGGM